MPCKNFHVAPGGGVEGVGERDVGAGPESDAVVLGGCGTCGEAAGMAGLGFCMGEKVEYSRVRPFRQYEKTTS